MANIIALLCREFALLISIAFVLAIPISWYMMHRWLENFVFHIDIGVLAFILGGLLAVAVGMLTISFHILRVASANPVDAIKHE